MNTTLFAAAVQQHVVSSRMTRIHGGTVHALTAWWLMSNLTWQDEAALWAGKQIGGAIVGA
jgi:hypothetical protein